MEMTAAMALQGATCHDIGDGYWCSFEELVLTLGLKSLATANYGGNGSVHCLRIHSATRMYVGRRSMNGMLAS